MSATLFSACRALAERGLAARLVLLGLIWRGRMGWAAGMIFVAAYVAYLALVVIAR